MYAIMPHNEGWMNLMCDFVFSHYSDCATHNRCEMYLTYAIRRLVQATTLISLLALYVDVTQRSAGLKLASRPQWRATYTMQRARHYFKPHFKHPWSPDTTAVILNWSRLPNVIQLAKVMCGSLQDTLAEVFIWNNNPDPLNESVSLTG